MPAFLSIEHVDVAYGSTRVLSDVSLEVERGEFIALLGSSGCGKTTLLRAISGFVRVGAGRIRVAERDVTHLPPDKRDMAMVFQSYALWPHMTAAQNIGYGLKLRRVPRAERERRIRDILAMLGLEGFGGRPVTQLSGGQRQRVALGRALAIDPRMLLLDEPLSNLDARIRLVVRHEIKALQTRLGITAIHVTHDREEAMVMADRIAVMNQGRIVQLGTPEELYERPNSPFVADFMGASNVLALTVQQRDGFLRIAAGPHNDGVELPVSRRFGDGGVHFRGQASGRVHAHFRSESALLALPGEAPANALLLHGRVAQASYPGGFYRYAVQVGDDQYLVDDARRLAVGDAVAIAIPPSSLHLYGGAEERLVA